MPLGPKTVYNERLFYLDVNSLYPTVMSMSLPYEVLFEVSIEECEEYVDYCKNEVDWNDLDYGIALYCTVKYPEDNYYINSLPTLFIQD